MNVSHTFKVGLAMALVLTTNAFSHAQQSIDMGSRFQINKDGSYIAFRTTMAGFPVIRGAVKSYQATMFYDPENIENTSITLRMGADGFTTVHDKRDEVLQGPEFLHSEKYPGIWFQGSEVQRTETGFDLTGTLNIKDITKQVTVSVTQPTVMRNAMNNMDLMMVSGSLKISRKDFDLGTTGEWSTNPMFGDEIEIEFNFMGFSYTIEYLTALYVNQADGRENPVGLVYNEVKANGVKSGQKLVDKLKKDKAYKSDNWSNNLANIGWILMVDGYGKESLPFYEMALEKNPKHLPSLLRLGDAYTIAGSYEEALKHFKAERNLSERARFTHIPHMIMRLNGSFDLRGMQ